MQEDLSGRRILASEEREGAMKRSSRVVGKEERAMCPSCREEIATGTEFCPACGGYLLRDHCSFCGFSLEEGEMFCPECGNPREGVVCPVCGTRSFRSFCTGCNAPLNGMAREELERAADDATFAGMKAVAATLAELEEVMEPGDARVSEARAFREKLLREYGELLEAGGGARAFVAKGVVSGVAGMSREEQEELYRRKVAEMQALMDSLKPPTGATPHEQRNFYAARQLPEAREKQGRLPVGWVCNYCRCRHHSPSGCVYPELGGKWVYGKE